MNTKYLLLASLIMGSLLADDKTAPTPPQRNFYLKLGSGVSYSNKAKISAPSSVWDTAAQGYDASLGKTPVIEAGLGYEFVPQFSADITFAYRPHYIYRKFQTPTSDNTTGFLGTKTRRFKLDVGSTLLSVYLSGRDLDYISWKWNSISSSLYPIIGGGVGVNQMKIYDFRSTGLAAVDPPLQAFATDNSYSICYRFGYQIMAGLEFRYHDRWAFSLGYRWFDVNTFKGPRYFRDQNGGAFDVGSDVWRIKFSANELFLDLKVFF